MAGTHTVFNMWQTACTPPAGGLYIIESHNLTANSCPDVATDSKYTLHTSTNASAAAAADNFSKKLSNTQLK